MIPERDLLRDGRRDIGRRRRQPRGQRLGCRRPLARQRGVDKAVLDREVPLDRQFLRRDQFDHLGDLGASISRVEPNVRKGSGHSPYSSPLDFDP